MKLFCSFRQNKKKKTIEKDDHGHDEYPPESQNYHGGHAEKGEEDGGGSKSLIGEFINLQDHVIDEHFNLECILKINEIERDIRNTMEYC